MVHAADRNEHDHAGYGEAGDDPQGEIPGPPPLVGGWVLAGSPGEYVFDVIVVRHGVLPNASAMRAGQSAHGSWCLRVSRFWVR
jgi:hypothetical protein